MRRAFFLTLGFAVFSCAVAMNTTFGPDRWTDLERVARQVPEFAGFTASTDKTGKQVTFLALTDKAKEQQLRQVLRADPYWKEKTNLIQPGSLKLKSSVMELLSVAKAVKKTTPKLSVRINTALNIVTVNADLNVIQNLRNQVGVGDILQKQDWFNPTPFKTNVLPRTVKKSELDSEARWGRVPDLHVLVTNTHDRPLYFSFGCGGALPVHVLDARGQELPTTDHLGCTSELRLMVIQPGQTVTFRSFSWTDLSQLAPGRYFWQQYRNSPRYAFNLVP